MICHLLEDKEDVRKLMALDANLNNKTAMHLIKDESESVRILLALNENINKVIIKQLTKDISINVRGALFFNKLTPKNIRHKLKKEPQIQSFIKKYNNRESLYRGLTQIYSMKNIIL